MALTQPILNTIAPFDATQEQTFTFQSSGSSAPIASNTLTIRNNATNAVVYEETQTTFAYRHVVPADTLTNGTTYTASIVTHDAQGDNSPSSNAILFYCFTTPTFAITNIPASNLIQNSSFEFNAAYNQTQGELLNAYVFNLYSQSGELISTSSTQYTTENTLPINVSWLFTGFTDNTQYAIEVVGQTVNGMSISTGIIQFGVSYSVAQIFSPLTLSNNCSGGYVTIQSKIVSVDGTSNPDPALYIDNEMVDLRADGSWVEFVSGYVLNGDYVLKLWSKDINANTTILRMSNTNGDTITVKYCEDNAAAWLEGYVAMIGYDFKYVIQTATIATPEANDELFIMLEKQNDIYQLTLSNLGVSV